MLGNRKAQAILELAVLGSLLILAFSIAIRYGEQYNRQQSYMQQTFRGNLKMARQAKGPTTYGTADYRRSSNMVDPLELGELQAFSGSNNLLWNEGKKDRVPEAPYGEPYEAKGYFRFNSGEVQEVAIGDAPANTGVTLTSRVNTSPHNDTWFDKTEQSGSISSNKSMNATDLLTASVPFANTTVSTSDELGDGGFYTGGGGIHRGRSLD